MKRLSLLFVFISGLLFGSVPFHSAHALEPSEVMVIANMNASASKGLAKYYMEKRGIPEQNLVLLFLTDKEHCSREEYEDKVIPKISRALDENKDIRALVTVYGIPLKIASPPLSPAEKKSMDQLRENIKTLEDSLKDPEMTDEKEIERIKEKAGRLKKQLSRTKKRMDRSAAFDSELMLVKKKGYRLDMWQMNPYYLPYAKVKNPPIKKTEVLMVSRLDAASPEIVRRIIDDSLEAEKNGLKGSAYFDARWKAPGEKKVSGYALYDRSIHRSARIITKRTQMKAILNDESELFKKGESPDTALYCGWYSHARYKDAFSWQKGSVGYHIASSECATLKNPNSRVWCKKMLDYGIAATIGPVGEPYVQSFPMPEIFFAFLTEGRLSLAECYLISLPYLSWKMVLVGDPLYTVNIPQKERDKKSELQDGS